MEKFHVGNRRRFFPVDELEENTAALRSWNREFEIPDVIAFADFTHSKRSVAESLFASQHRFTWARALHFPYPNGRKLRNFVVLEAPDLALLRASAGRIARPVERRLSRWSLGSRTMRSGAAWQFCNVRHAWKHFTDSAIRLLQRADINAMCATDIANYYGSIDLDRLETRLYDIGCDLQAVAVLLSGLRKWAAVDGIAGVPIGPEASGVLGNAFLIPVDRMLMSIGAYYVRWMDDYKVMGRDDEACGSIVTRFDHFLGTQGLTRSGEKTRYYSDSLAAMAALRDGRLASLGYWLELGTDRTTSELRAAFDRHIVGEDEVSRSRFRYILGTLRNCGDDYAAAVLAEDPDLANIDPQWSGKYLASVGLDKSAITDRMLAQLATEPADETDALALHFLRALGQKPGGWGTVEADFFESVAESGSRRPPVRCWAVQAFSRTCRWHQGSLMESAEAEADPLVRRIKVTTLTKVRPGRKRTKFLRHMCDKFPELIHTARWLDNVA
jgi:hypothetical protein